jgi:hypothetical protein
LCDLFAKPHQEDRAADERDHSRGAEEESGIEHDTACGVSRSLEPDGDAVALQRRENHRHIARILVDLLPAGLAFLFQRLELRRDRSHQLHDDRSRDVGHDVEREDRQPFERSTREHVEHAKDAAGLRPERFCECRRVDARQGNECAQAIDDERANGEPQAAL